MLLRRSFTGKKLIRTFHLGKDNDLVEAKRRFWSVFRIFLGFLSIVVLASISMFIWIGILEAQWGKKDVKTPPTRPQAATESVSRVLADGTIDLTDVESIDWGKYGKLATVYGYSSTEDQTDSSPLLTANLTHVVDGGIANNCLPFGTRVVVKEKEFVAIYFVNDRMNKRYGCDVFDIWFPTRGQAQAFGKQNLLITILP